VRKGQRPLCRWSRRCRRSAAAGPPAAAAGCGLRGPGYDHHKYRKAGPDGTEHGSGLGVYRWVVEQSTELDFDPLVDAADIIIKNMNGDAALNSSVPSYPQCREAAARRVHGVTSVHNHLMVILPPRDYRDDPTLTTAANNALALNITVPDGVEAKASDADVWLTGPSRRTGRCSR
jgi:hypothetical protein